MNKEGVQPEFGPFSDAETRDAAKKAMQLLLYKDRSEKELSERLHIAGFSEKASEGALEYVKSFGYINDRRYAENYVISMKDRKSRASMRRFLEEKGVNDEYIALALDSADIDDDSVIGELIRKKAGDPHPMDEKELRRVYGFLARKGFPSGEIWKAIHRYQNEASDAADDHCTDRN